MNLITEQEKYWDSVSGTKEFPTPFQMKEYEKYVEKEMKILDVGCGYGRTLNELHNCGYVNLYGVDFSQGMIDRGMRQYPYLNLRKNTHGRLPFNDSSFDSVIMLAVLTCISETNEQQKLLSEISRVLKPSGILYINDYLLNTDERNIDRYNKFKDKHGEYGIFELSEGAVLRHHSKEYILKITTDFKPLIFEQLVYTTMNGHKSNGFYFIGRANK